MTSTPVVLHNQFWRPRIMAVWISKRNTSNGKFQRHLTLLTNGLALELAIG